MADEVAMHPSYLLKIDGGEFKIHQRFHGKTGCSSEKKASSGEVTTAINL